MKLKKLAIDVDAAEDGKWFDFSGEVKFKIGRLNNRKYQLKYAAELNTAFEEYGDKIPSDDYEKIMTVALASCVTDWSGIENDDDSDFEYSDERAVELLLDPEYKDIRDFVAMKSNIISNFRKKAATKIKKN